MSYNSSNRIKTQKIYSPAWEEGIQKCRHFYCMPRWLLAIQRGLNKCG